MIVKQILVKKIQTNGYYYFKILLYINMSITLTAEQEENLDNYQISLDDFNNLKDTYNLYNYYTTNSKTLNLDVQTNNRKTFYEEQGIGNLNYYYEVLFYIYFFVFIAIIIALFTSQLNYSLTVNIIVIILMIIYPFISTIIFAYIMHFFTGVNNLIPTDIYSKL
jgi:hypothetical protein